MLSICNINSVVPTLLSNIILPQMIKRQRGLILTMASAAALRPTGFVPIYESTKSYVLQLSQSLQKAYPTNETGLVFHAFHPLFIQTPMTTKNNDISPFIPFSAISQSYVFPDVNNWVESALKVMFTNVI